MNTSGSKLRELRGDETLAFVASNLEITPQALSNYELDLRIPRDEVKVKIANYYGVSVEWLFFNHKSNI